MKERINTLLKKFRELFGKNTHPEIVSAPGRVNIIGEHTDYNSGLVLPTAVDREILVAAQNRKDNNLRFFSVDYNESFETNLTGLKFSSKIKWANYLMGVFYFLKDSGFKLKGVNLVFTGNVPQGGGLSSSAALEVATAYTVRTLQELALDDIDMIKLCQKAENKFVGVMCGIMDQFASTMSRKNHLLSLDCANLSYELIPMDFSNLKIVLADTKKERTLSGSEYNRRRKQCKEGVRILKKYLPSIRVLRDVKLSDFKKYKKKLRDPLNRRVEHVIYEIERVKKAISAIKENDLIALGKLLYESHDSLKNLFEVSCPELDLMVDLAKEVNGVYGSRLLGGGFGGCTISLVKTEAVEDFKSKILSEYPKRTNKFPEIWICNSSDGVKNITY